MKRVLFLCTHNSSRSQMAEGLLRHMAGERYEVHSAGTEPGHVHPMAVEVMREIGIDISHHTSKSVEEFLGMDVDVVVTVCDHAAEACPFLPGAKRCVHRSFPDPSTAGDPERMLEEFRSVREMLRDWISEEFAAGGDSKTY